MSAALVTRRACKMASEPHHLTFRNPLLADDALGGGGSGMGWGRSTPADGTTSLPRSFLLAPQQEGHTTDYALLVCEPLAKMQSPYRVYRGSGRPRPVGCPWPCLKDGNQLVVPSLCAGGAALPGSSDVLPIHKCSLLGECSPAVWAHGGLHDPAARAVVVSAHLRPTAWWQGCQWQGL